MNFKKTLKRISLFFISIHDRLSINSKKFDHNQVNRLVIFIGPYRNLTTYLASMFSLHPKLLVLNHAGKRVLRIEKINFLTGYSIEKYEHFLNFFIHALKTGYKGMRGGSIKYSHAFESNKNLDALFSKNKVNIDEPFSMVWKESHMITNILMKNEQDLIHLLKSNVSINFLFPVRHPLDCATSNIKTNKYRFFGSQIPPELKEITQAIFTQYNFFLSFQKRFPDRFYFLFEHKINKDEITEICNFLNVENDKGWQKLFLQNYKIKPSYSYSIEIKNWCLNEIEKTFKDHLEFKTDLISLINKPS